MTPGANLDRHPQKKTIFRDLVPSTTFPPSAPLGSMAPWIRSKEPGKSEETLGGKMNLSPWRVAWERDDLEGLKGEGEDSMPFFSLLLLLSLYLSISISLYLYLLVRAWTELLARWRVVVGHWVAIFAWEEKDRRMLKRDHFPGEILFRNSSLPGFIYIPSSSPPLPKFISSLFHSVNY